MYFKYCLCVIAVVLLIDLPSCHADYDKLKELGYLWRTLTASSKAYHANELTKDQINAANDECGPAHLTSGDASIEKMRKYLLDSPPKENFLSSMEEIFSHWWRYHLPSIHNYSHCMGNLLKLTVWYQPYV
ncbi:unnamed protein product [Brassicogethes aeneus]|uniref:Uncharacterized protein n=1 Tax=Brassicogethes aeneus TaxID=1431903 RepID=A0A9P0AMT3_BRAAE|nr:unnamed protein product [Brassicogethes aeneus]